MKCEYCKQEFQTENPRARFCSDKCRIYLKRQKERGTVGDAPDTSDLAEIAMEESYDVPGVDPFWTKPHKLVFHSNSEWRGCCVGVGKWVARCPRTKEVIEAGSYHEMMAKAKEAAQGHIAEDIALPSWTARMPQSVKLPRELDRTKTQLPAGKKGGES
jgi:predicted RNase H-like HicB family nuclease